MAKHSNGDGSSHGAGSLGHASGTMHQGLYRKNPKNAGDSSRKLPTKETVDSGATRTEVGHATNNLGPRQA
jgi:hypothetical protein